MAAKFLCIALLAFPAALCQPMFGKLGDQAAKSLVHLAADTVRTGVRVTANSTHAGTKMGDVVNDLGRNLTFSGIGLAQDAANTTFKLSHLLVDRISIAGGAALDPLPETVSNAIDVVNDVANAVADKIVKLETARHELVQSALSGVRDLNAFNAAKIEQLINKAEDIAQGLLGEGTKSVKVQVDASQ